MNEQEIVDRLREWFTDYTGHECDGPTNYLESGLLDSFGVIRLVFHVEQAFKIRLQIEDLQSEDFATLGGLARLIAARWSKS